METTKKTSRKSKTVGKDRILDAYRKTVLKEGKDPSSVFIFADSLGIKESEFYKHFASFDAIGNEIWSAYIAEVEARLNLDRNYTEFSIREKILAFYFTLAEVLREDRSFALLTLKPWKNPGLPPKSLKGFKNGFDTWLAPILNEGKQSGEIAKRPLLDTRYDALFWLHLVFILQFWANDDSSGFERTDAAIEKSVNLAFDLIGKGILDNALDFGKFLYQNAKN